MHPKYLTIYFLILFLSCIPQKDPDSADGLGFAAIGQASATDGGVAGTGESTETPEQSNLSENTPVVEATSGQEMTPVNLTGDSQGKLDSLVVNGVVIALLTDNFGVDFNFDGTRDAFYTVNDQGQIEFWTGQDGQGNQIAYIPNVGWDYDGDGIADDMTVQQVLADSTPPTSSINVTNGQYLAPNFTITITCNEGGQNGYVAYNASTTGTPSDPDFQPSQVGTVFSPAQVAQFPVNETGTWEIKYRCMDAARNKETPVKEVSVIVNDSTPVITISGFPDVSPSGRTVSNGTLSSDIPGSLTIHSDSCSGTEVDNIGAVLKDSPQAAGFAVGSLAVGNNQFFARLVGDNGNTGCQSFNIIKDETAPTITLLPVAGNYSTAQLVTVTGSDSDSGLQAFAYTTTSTSDQNTPADPPTPGFSDYDGNVNGASTLYTAPVNLGDPEKSKYCAIAQDRAGNTSAPVCAYLIVDTASRTIVFSGTPTENEIERGQSLSATITGNKQGPYSILIGGNSCADASNPVGTNSNISGWLEANSGISFTLDPDNFSTDGTVFVRVEHQNLIGQSFCASYELTVKAPTGGTPDGVKNSIFQGLQWISPSTNWPFYFCKPNGPFAPCSNLGMYPKDFGNFSQVGFSDTITDFGSQRKVVVNFDSLTMRIESLTNDWWIADTTASNLSFEIIYDIGSGGILTFNSFGPVAMGSRSTTVLQYDNNTPSSTDPQNITNFRSYVSAAWASHATPFIQESLKNYYIQLFNN